MPDNEEQWVSLNGCHTCINGALCKQLGNCAILTIDKHYPEYNKRKRRVIAHLKTFHTPNSMEYLIERIRKDGKNHEEELMAKESSSNPVVRLTKIEQIFIDSLNRKR